MTHSSQSPRSTAQTVADGPETAATEYGIARHVAVAVGTIGVLVLGCGGWAATAELAGAIIAHGSVVVERHVQKVQHRDGGIIAAINVRNGDHVEAGATLIRLDDTVTRAECGIIQSQLVELRGRLARLVAERDQADRIVFPPEIKALPGAASIMAGETRLFVSNREGRESQKQQLELRILQLQEEITGIGAQRDAKLKELNIFREELEQVRQLYNQRLTPLSRVYALEREEARIGGEHGNQVAQGARVAGQISETRLQILNIDLTTRTEAQRELRSVEARIGELVEREVAAKDRLGRTDIKAPQSGLVHELEVHTVGGIITPAEPIMLIVPEGEALSIEVRISPNDINQIHIDQDVRLRFTSFNRRTTPELKGKIVYVSADVSQDPKSRQEYYSARAKPLGTHAWKIDAKPILPGMPVEAFITTVKRTALSYLMKPLVDQFSRAFREQ